MAIFYNLEIQGVNGATNPPGDTAALNFKENAQTGDIIGTIFGFDPQEDLSKVIFTPNTDPGAAGDDYGRYGIKWDAGFNAWVLYIVDGGPVNFNFEDKNGPSNLWKNLVDFNVTFQAGYTPKADYGVSFALNIQNVNEAVSDLIFGPDATLVAGSTPSGTNVVQATWVDPDTTVGFKGNKYAFLAADGQTLLTTDGGFSIDEVTGQITTNGNFNSEVAGARTLKVVAYDVGAEGTADKLRYVEDHVVTIAAAANTAPSNVHLVSGGTTTAVGENAAANAVVGTVTADDDGGPAGLRYAMANNANFDVNATTGEIFVKSGAALNYEGTSAYTVAVTVTDTNGTGLATTQNITINLNDVNEAPTNVNLTNAQTLQAGSTGAGANVVLATAVDPDTLNAAFRNDQYAFLVNGNLVTTDGKFSIDATTGQVTTNAAMTAADVGQTTLHVVTYDAGNNALRFAKDHVVTIAAAANTAPSNVHLVSGGTTTAVGENAPANAVVGTVTADDDGGPAGLRYAMANNANFDVNATTGEIFVKSGAALNYEGTSAYTVAVTVTDTNGTGLATTQNITINLNDVNEAPTNVNLTNAQTLQAGSTGAGANVVLATAVDPDTLNAAFRNDQYAFLVNGNLVTTDGKFSIDATTGQVTTNAAMTAADVGQTTLHVVTYDAGNNALRFAKDHVVTIAAAANTAPSNVHLVSGGTTTAVGENAPVNAVVGTVTADDDGGPAGLRYAMANNANFDINATTGEIFVKNGAALNYEGTNAYTVAVTVTDTNGTGLSTTQDITINLNDVNEAPTNVNLTNVQTLQAGSTGAGANVVLATAVDPDTLNAAFRNDKYAFLVNGNLVTTDGKFSIDATTGQVTTNAAMTAADVGQTTLHVVTYDAGNNALRFAKDHVVTIAPNPNALPEFSIAATDAVKAEGDSGYTELTFSITRTGDTSVGGTVKWTVEGTGDHPAATGDFIAGFLSNVETFNAGQATKQITIRVAGDLEWEADETFHVVLSEPTNGTISVTQGAADGAIVDDDRPLLSIASQTGTQVAEGDAGMVDYVFRVFRDKTGAPSSATWTVSGMGIDAGDFEALTGTVDFAADQQFKDIVLKVKSDKIEELNETFTITLSDAVNARLGSQSAATGTIVNDDHEPTFQVVTGKDYFTGTQGVAIDGVLAGVDLDDADGDPLTLTVSFTDANGALNGMATGGGVTVTDLGTNPNGIHSYKLEGSAFGIETLLGAASFTPAHGNETTSFSFTLTDGFNPVRAYGDRVTVLGEFAGNHAPARPSGSFEVHDSRGEGFVVVDTLPQVDDEGTVIDYTFFGAQDGSNGLISGDGRFKIVGNQIVVNDPSNLDVNTDSQQTYVVFASDGTYTVQGNLTITVKNNLAPAISAVVASGNGEAGANSSVVVKETAGAGEIAMVTAVDQDAARDGRALHYSLASTYNGLFAIDDAGKISIADASKLPVAADTPYQLQVIVSDGSDTTTQAVTVEVKDVNVAPGPISPTVFSVREYTSAGVVLGALSATDPDGDALSYSLVDSAGGRVKLAGNQLVVDNGFLFDFEQAREHKVTVQVSDGKGGAHNEVLMINVADWGPEIIGGTSGNDVFYGGATKDKINGGAGNDRLFGGLNADIVKGLTGNDTVGGGAGKDKLFGGKGKFSKDMFVFDTKLTSAKVAKKNVDKIYDFGPKYDSLGFDDLAFTNRTIAKYVKKKGGATLDHALKIDKHWFRVGDKALDRNDFFIYNDKTHKLYFDVDGSGHKAMVEVASFAAFEKKAGLALTFKDFFLI